MNSTGSDLYQRLRQDPVVLLLGQDSLRQEFGKDIFLEQILAKYSSDYSNLETYNDIWQSNFQGQTETALAWMQRLSDRLSIPEWMRVVANFAWSHVYTSAIDTVWWRAFRVEWRELSPIFSERYRPIDIRSRSLLHCTFLYGCVNQTEEIDRPPLNRLEFLRRKQTAVILGRRIPEIITPFGTLIIEGYAGSNDWFSPDDFAPIIDELRPGQVHLFSVENHRVENSDLSALVSQGKIIIHSESLAFFIQKGNQSGDISLGLSSISEESNRKISINGQTCSIPMDLWNQITRTATVLGPDIVVDPSPISKDMNYLEFRRFLLESGVRPVWSGFSRGYAFRRDFETELHKRVDNRLQSTSLQNEPLILHGSSGTGKTIALGALAFERLKEGRYPILFIERKSQRPLNVDIDAFCKWAEDNGAETTLIIWDGMVDVSQYYELLHYLVSRGRKVVLVGSSYRVFEAEGTTNKSDFIPLPSQLTGTELKRFSEFLNGFEPALGERISKFVDSSFLVALYRLLPSTRAGIRTSLIKEVGFAEEVISKHTKDADVMPSGSLGYALWKAGLIDIENVFNETRQIGGEEFTTPQEIIGLVMIPGKFGLRVPLELLIRALKKDWLENVEKILKVDLFRVDEDHHGNITVSPRHPLEARLISQARFGMAKQEVEFVDSLLSKIWDDSTSENIEVQFAIDLIRSMGPNGQDVEYFAPCFLDLSGILERLRLSHSIQIPRLMLQEATLIREYVVKQSKINEPPQNSEELLKKAEQTLKQSLELVSNDRKNARLRSVILVELGAVIGSRNRYILDYSVNRQEVYKTFQSARQHLNKARTLAPSDYHSIDVLGWMSEDLLRSNLLEKKDRFDIIADILHLFSQANTEDFDAVQRGYFDQRRMKIGAVLEDEKMIEEAFRSLVEQGSAAGYYLKAASIAGDIPRNRELFPEEREHCLKGADFLLKNREKIETDGRCLYMLLKCWWSSVVGKPMFFSERQILPFSANDWQFLDRLLSSLMSTEENHDNLSLHYLQGLASFHLGSIEKSITIFRELDRNAEYIQGRRRILRSYLASLPNGEPRIFHGTVAWIDEDRNRGQVSVEELRYRIDMLPLDFRRDLKKGDPISGGFHIAFNFIGPLADPTKLSRTQLRKDI